MTFEHREDGTVESKLNCFQWLLTPTAFSFASKIAPGITENRPQPGSQPIREIDRTHSGYATSVAQNWYDNLTVAGNTSLNPFFYGTYLGETKKNEPVTRNKNQAFQADAVGAMKQLVPEHFKTPHTFRLEWQPGRGGRLDWFTKSYKKVDGNGTVFHIEGDGKGQDWEHSLHIPDFALDEAMGSKIPEEPSYVILNTAISSTWAFPYDIPDWCTKCYDCYDPKCQCSFNPGFCNMMKTGKVALKVDSVRVYQSKDDSKHSGGPHTVGCDPPDFPTREFIKGYEYKYMRNPPFVYEDKHPLRQIKKGGSECRVDADCGGGGAEDVEVDESWRIPVHEAASKKRNEDVLDLDDDSSKGGNAREYQSPQAHMNNKGKSSSQARRLADSSTTSDGSAPEGDASRNGTGNTTDNGLVHPPISEESLEDTAEDTKVLSTPGRKPKGQCVVSTAGLFGAESSTGKVCKCNKGYTGPNCLSIDKSDDEPGAYELKKVTTLLGDFSTPYLSRIQLFIGGVMFGAFVVAVLSGILQKGR